MQIASTRECVLRYALFPVRTDLGASCRVVLVKLSQLSGIFCRECCVIRQVLAGCGGLQSYLCPCVNTFGCSILFLFVGRTCSAEALEVCVIHFIPFFKALPHFVNIHIWARLYALYVMLASCVGILFGANPNSDWLPYRGTACKHFKSCKLGCARSRLPFMLRMSRAIPGTYMHLLRQVLLTQTIIVS